MLEETPKNVLEVTPISDWSKIVEGEPMELPSGKVARIRKRSIFFLAKTGQLPNELKGIVQKFIDSPQGARAIAGQNLDAMIDLIDRVAIACFVYPKLTDKEPNLELNEISVNDVDLQDKLFMFLWSSGEVRDLETFRQQQAEFVRDLHDGEDVQTETQ